VDDRLSLLLNRGLLSGEIWLAVAYIVSMIAAAAFRSQQIASPSLFRMSFILFGLYLIIPTFVEGIVLMLTLDSTGPFRGSNGIGFTLVMPLFTIFGKILFGISVICALACFKLGGKAPSYSNRDED
jgi:ABC-type tungstate transport system substrate-binding protein